jgi:protein subunit release factor A
MDQSGELDAEMREMVRGEQKELVIKQLELEAAITTMLLPSDPNDDRYNSKFIIQQTLSSIEQI